MKPIDNSIRPGNQDISSEVVNFPLLPKAKSEQRINQEIDELGRNILIAYAVIDDLLLRRINLLSQLIDIKAGSK